MTEPNNPLVARAVGAVQILGGGLEIALGLGGVVLPEPATTVGGVILIAHGGDTVIAGFRSLIYGEIHESFTKQGGTAAAQALGASSEVSHGVGIGVDITAGVGPSIAVAVSRRLAISAAQNASEKVAVAYLSRGALQMGHNAVGVTQGGQTAWFHFAGQPIGSFVAARTPNSRYVVTNLAVTRAQASGATTAAGQLARDGQATWRLCGPNCSTTALKALRNAGVVVPEWGRSPFLLSAGVRAGGEVTVVGGTAATTAPALMQGR